MKKGLLLLFVGLIILVALAACGPEKPLCPAWAIQKFGQHCQSDSLSITPDDIISLDTWQFGQIQLNDSYVDNVYGIEFFKSDGSQIESKDMEQGVFYSFEKTTATAVFHIWPDQNYGPLSADTHILLAKP